MQSLLNFVNESLSTKQKELVGKIFSEMFKNTKINKDQFVIILNNLDKDIILEISKYFSTNDSNDYLAYEPNEDMFLKYEDNKERIISQIAEFINKYKI